jgi:hypothetical protein
MTLDEDHIIDAIHSVMAGCDSANAQWHGVETSMAAHHTVRLSAYILPQTVSEIVPGWLIEGIVAVCADDGDEISYDLFKLHTPWHEKEKPLEWLPHFACDWYKHPEKWTRHWWPPSHADMVALGLSAANIKRQKRSIGE